jgi:hypothetical protein
MNSIQWLMSKRAADPNTYKKNLNFANDYRQIGQGVMPSSDGLSNDSSPDESMMSTVDQDNEAGNNMALYNRVRPAWGNPGKRTSNPSPGVYFDSAGKAVPYSNSKNPYEETLYDKTMPSALGGGKNSSQPYEGSNDESTMSTVDQDDATGEAQRRQQSANYGKNSLPDDYTSSDADGMDVSQEAAKIRNNKPKLVSKSTKSDRFVNPYAKKPAPAATPVEPEAGWGNEDQESETRSANNNFKSEARNNAKPKVDFSQADAAIRGYAPALEDQKTDTSARFARDMSGRSK